MTMKSEFFLGKPFAKGRKKAGLLHRTAQPPTLAAFRPWEDSAGAGRVRPAGREDRDFEVSLYIVWGEFSNAGTAA